MSLRLVLPAACLIALVGCPAAPTVQPSGGSLVASPIASPQADASATAAAPASAPASPKPSPSASATAKPTAAPTAKPTAAPSPKPYQGDAFYFTYPATWKIASEQKNPVVLTLTPANGNGSFQVKEILTYTSIDQLRKDLVTQADKGLVSNTATKLNLISGYTVVANLGLGADSRFNTSRVYIYRQSAWEIISQWDAKQASATQNGKDVDAMVASWVWQ